MNGFKAGGFLNDDQTFLTKFQTREFSAAGKILNITELASLWHLPTIAVATPNIVWSGSKKGEPPANLPVVGTVPSEELTVLGETDFRTGKRRFGVKLDDRRRHVYLIGKTGVGKSVLIANMALSDIHAGHGVAIVDPHGELIDEIMRRIPEHRLQDVILLDPADREFPIGFNLLETVDDDYKGLVASGFVGIMKKLFGFSWGPRMEYILRNTILALLDNDDQTMLGIPKILTDKKYRDVMIKNVKDPVIKDFWVNEFAQYDVKFRTEAVSPILNKVGQFLSTTTIRNIVGQAKSSINIRQIMDNKKILLINLSRGKIGEDNSALLGAMLITKIQLAAMSRSDIPREKDRIDFFLYVDEFQNFATESFASILSEARKYRLNLTMAHQYVAQMEEMVRDAVIGNVGTIVAFRVGAPDSEFLVSEFAPVFEANDLVNLPKYHIYLKLMVDGIASPAFSATTLPLADEETGNIEKIRATTRATYTKPRDEIEQQISDWALGSNLEPTPAELAMASLKTVLDNGSPVIPEVGESLAAREQPKGVDPDQPTSQLENQKTTFNPADLIGVSDDKVKRFNPADLIGSQSDTEKSIGKAVIGNRIYREVSAKGGDKWFFGAVLTDEDKEKIADKLLKRRRPKQSPAEGSADGGEGSPQSVSSPVATIVPGETVKLDSDKKIEDS
ncbi:type IV secretion system DNA-binding domain-containing protein [Candidatus Berkelbacteria bacterium]|nr:type IV secretion system DNA-binding domain-containing protein [Candidatus Berkelbacteria bacterium]